MHELDQLLDKWRQLFLLATRQFVLIKFEHYQYRADSMNDDFGPENLVELRRIDLPHCQNLRTVCLDVHQNVFDKN